jgi:hypothetical protein
MNRYYHLTNTPLVFADRKSFSRGEKKPSGVYCTKFPAYFINLLYYDICTQEIWNKNKTDYCMVKLPCFMYAIDIPRSRFTTDPTTPQPEKILKVTRKNWRKVGAYMQTHTRQDLFRDFGGLDADDKALHAYLSSQAYSAESLANSWDKSNRQSTLIHMFPYGFSGLTFDTITAPEACIWRASAWIEPRLVEKKDADALINKRGKRNVFDPKHSATPYEDPIQEKSRQLYLAGEWLDTVIEAFDAKSRSLPEEAMSWVRASALHRWYRKETGNPASISVHIFTEVAINMEFIFKVGEKEGNNEVWLSGRLIRQPPTPFTERDLKA